MDETHLKELEKRECLSSVINIAPLLNIEREEMGTMGIVMIIDDGVYLCICTVYSYVLKKFTQHASVYGGHFSKK